MSDFDAASAATLTRDGGVYANSSPLVLSGPLTLLGAAILAGAVCITPAGSGKRFVHGDSDYFTYSPGHPGAARTTLQDFASAVMPAEGMAKIIIDGGAHRVLNANTSLVPFQQKVRGVHGGNLATVTVSFYVPDPHAGGVPQYMPRMRMVLLGLDGTKTPLASPAGGFNADKNGWIQIPAPVSGTAWHASGAIKTFTYHLDAGYVHDATEGVLFFELFDESGTNAASNNWASLQGGWQAIPGLGPQ
jgi:hypothetical protein